MMISFLAQSVVDAENVKENVGVKKKNPCSNASAYSNVYGSMLFHLFRAVYSYTSLRFIDKHCKNSICSSPPHSVLKIVPRQRDRLRCCVKNKVTSEKKFSSSLIVSFCQGFLTEQSLGVSFFLDTKHDPEHVGGVGSLWTAIFPSQKMKFRLLLHIPTDFFPLIFFFDCD